MSEVDVKLSNFTLVGFLAEPSVPRGPDGWLVTAWAIMLSFSIFVYYGLGKLALYLLNV